MYVYNVYIYSLPVNAIVHLWSGDSQDHKTFLTPLDDSQTLNYDKEYPIHHPFLLI